MNIGIRFSPPIPDENDLKLLSESFDNNVEKIEEILDEAPYEISILACLLKRLDKIIK